MNEQHLDTVREDLRYVRNVIVRHGDEPPPLYSRIMWSLFCLTGFVWLDFWPSSAAGNFLLFGGIGCTLLEFVFAATIGDRDREKNKEQELRILLHSLTFTLCTIVIAVLAVRGHFTKGYSFGQMILVVLGFHFITAGLHFTSTEVVPENGARGLVKI